jgi:hypothetical protein
MILNSKGTLVSMAILIFVFDGTFGLILKQVFWTFKPFGVSHFH